MLLSAVAPVAASNDIKVIVDGIVVNFDVQPQIIDGRTMVPLRAIFEALGATVDWNESTKTITANKGDLFVKCAIGSYSMDTSSGTKTIDVPPTIINSRTLVPARFIAEGFNCDVQWDAANRRVTITSAPVEYVIVEHGDKKDEQKDNTVKKSDSTVKNNEKTEQNYPVKNSDSTVKNDNKTEQGDTVINNNAKNNRKKYYSGTDIPTDESVTGVKLKETEILDGGAHLYTYECYDTQEMIDYLDYLEKNGWTYHDYVYDEEAFRISAYMNKGITVVGVTYVARYEEVWIMFE